MSDDYSGYVVSTTPDPLTGLPATVRRYEMSDTIKERLRSPTGFAGTTSEDSHETFDPLRLEAADEIERLEADKVQLQIAYSVECDSVARLEADNARLRGIIELSDAALTPENIRTSDRLEAEVARLRAALGQASDSVMDEFKEELTAQQRRYIVDQIVRRAAGV